ncbi:2-keto-3-deoxygluconate permease [Thermosediminibacter oceani]|uniref:2-keto-3-deoxygluconate permease (TC 2.A.10.1.1) n=1 Tax=Thermosediminibacter oceani (strain ATCC BAA-1034 / DSM 16646 / JW/IW-1228P) TaxID=555079 RepID=D9S1Z7_THEOJ|nr:2-keto-3-deoxygluconate permease [Thermosediminibacter oceani]ADL07424.1 2-keto-3-deoxygluconate permease (TC 2.A.10.1.1) [Thermosediminibacter oceani DSM 16646]
MKILKAINRVPGGLMVVPLLLGAIINTFFPQVLQIGGFTTALFKQGAMPLIALFLLCNGAQITIRQAGVSLGKGVALTAVKFFIGAVLGWFVGKFMGPSGLLGLSSLAIIAAVTNSNGGLYTALASQYGDPTDVGAIAVLSINDGPFLTMVAMGATGLANIPFIALVAVVVPILVGMVLGNLDEDWKNFLEPGQKLLIPFFAFPLGAALDFRTILKAGLPGVLLGLLTVAITGLGGYLTIKYVFREKKGVGAAIGNTAGNAVATPAALAAADPTLAPLVAAATAQVAASVIITAILCPLLVSYLDKIERGNDNSLRREKVV